MFTPYLHPGRNILRQQAETTTGGTTWPPTSLLSAVNSTLRGSNNMDRSIGEFLDHVQTDQQEYFVKRLKEYEAMLHLIGLLAGIVGTEEAQTAAQDAVRSAIETYLDSISISEEVPITFEAPIGARPETSSGMAIGYLFNRYVLGHTDDENIFAEASRANTRANEAVRHMISDLFTSVWSSLVKWYNDFWELYEKEGLLIAMNRLRIDVAFFAAECAIDIALSIALPAAGAAIAGALKNLRFVGMRVSRRMTRVAIHAIPEGGGTSIKLTQIDILDEDIAPDIDRIIDEDRLGGGSPIDETTDRASPNATKPSTTIIPGHGRNTATVEVDPVTQRPKSVEATIMDDVGANTRTDNATQIGRLGNEGDHGGHLIAHRFMGDVPDVGIVPQAGNLNTGAWKRMENEWADWITRYKPRDGTHVEIDVKIDIDPPGAVRPEKFDVEYSVFEVDAAGNRRRIHRNRTEFENKAGETFNRVRFRTDGTIR